MEVTMNLQNLGRWLALVVLSLGLTAGNSMAQLSGLFQQLGGMDGIGKLSSSFLQSAVKDPRLSGLLGKVNPSALNPKLTEQMCSMLGGGCKAPLTDKQIADGEKKLDANQKDALTDNFSSSLGSAAGNPLVNQSVKSIVGPKLGGIVGALL
jgi:hypothetical protein